MTKNYFDDDGDGDCDTFGYDGDGGDDTFDYDGDGGDAAFEDDDDNGKVGEYGVLLGEEDVLELQE